MFFPLFLLSPWPSATQLEGKTEKLKMCVSFPFLSSASPFTTFKNCFPLTCPSFSDLYSFLPSKFSLQADTWHLSKSWTWKKKMLRSTFANSFISTSVALNLAFLVSQALPLCNFSKIAPCLPYSGLSSSSVAPSIHTLPSLTSATTFSPFFTNFSPCSFPTDSLIPPLSVCSTLLNESNLFWQYPKEVVRIDTVRTVFYQENNNNGSLQSLTI